MTPTFGVYKEILQINNKKDRQPNVKIDKRTEKTFDKIAHSYG